MTITLTTSGAVSIKAGVNHKVLADASYVTFINQAEGDICADTGINWVSKSATMTENLSGAVAGAVSNKAAIYVINNDMSGFTSRQEALNMLNVLAWAYDKTVARLRDDKVKKLFGVT